MIRWSSFEAGNCVSNSKCRRIENTSRNFGATNVYLACFVDLEIFITTERGQLCFVGVYEALVVLFRCVCFFCGGGGVFNGTGVNENITIFIYLKIDNSHVELFDEMITYFSNFSVI